MSNPLALFDLDSTLADFNRDMHKGLMALAAPGESVRLSGPFPVHIKARRTLIKQQPGFWECLPRVKAGFEVLEMVTDLGYDSHVLTKGPVRSTNAWTEKVKWCQREIPDVPITITQDKSLVYGRVLVDDWPKYVDPWLKHRPRGLVVMLDWPHNQGYEHPNVFRYYQHKRTSPLWAPQVLALKERLIHARDRQDGDP